MDVGRVAEAIASILLNLPQLDKLIALRGAEQRVAIILSGFILCCHDSPPLQRYLLDVNRRLAARRANEARPATSAMGLVSRVSPVHTALRNCTRDEGRSFEVGNQVLISSHRKLLSSKAMVVNVAEKSEQDFDGHD